MRQALEMALEALEANYLLVNGTETHGGLEQCLDGYYSGCFDTDPINKQTEEAITAIKEALAQPERDYERGFIDGMQKQMQSSVDKAVNAMSRTWIGLTDEEREQVINLNTTTGLWHMAKAIETKLKEKNNG